MPIYTIKLENLKEDNKRKCLHLMTRFSDFNAVIFDMDGVFVDTEPIIFEAFRRVFKPKGIELSDEYLYNLVGYPTSQNLQDISRDYDVNLDIAKYIKYIEDTYLKLIQENPFTAQVGVWPLVDTAKKEGLKIGLCTSSKRKIVKTILKKVIEYDRPGYTFENLFDEIVTLDSVSHKKPHLEPYIKIATYLNVLPSRCLVIEDSNSGVESAQTAGCYCIALKTFYNRHQNLSIANKVVDSLDELKFLFQNK